MINLVPPPGLAAVKKEYWLRVASVWLFLFGTVCLIGATFLLPSYIQLTAQINDAKSTMVSLNDTATSFDISAAQLITANQQAALLVHNADNTALTDYIARAESLVQPGITLTSFVLQVRPETNPTFTVSGQAATRQTLVAFRDALEATTEFVEVSLPISNLITNQDIPFAMDITIATSTSEI